MLKSGKYLIFCGLLSFSNQSYCAANTSKVDALENLSGRTVSAGVQTVEKLGRMVEAATTEKALQTKEGMATGVAGIAGATAVAVPVTAPVAVPVAGIAAATAAGIHAKREIMYPSPKE